MHISDHSKIIVTVILKGGLGNQLFQLACGLATAKRNNVGFVLEDSESHTMGQGSHPRKYYKNIFSRILVRDPLDHGVIYRHTETTFSWQKELNNFVSEILAGDGHCGDGKFVLEGYFQTAKYFDGLEDYIYDAFTPMEGLVQVIARDTDIFLRYPELHPGKVGIVDKYCLLGVRRGDYMKDSWNIEFHNPCGIEYYRKAIAHMNADVYYVISDDIVWCKEEFCKEFPDEHFEFLKESDDLVTFYFARLFRHYICANSSFHWWASYLSYYKKRVSDRVEGSDGLVVICPKEHFGIHGPQDYQDYFRDGMILL